MAANRGRVIRTVYGLLSNYAPLVAKLYNASADSILGSTLQVDQLPVPSLVLALGASDPEQRGEVWVWEIPVEVYAEDVFDAADVLDLIEAACNDYRADAAWSTIALAQVDYRGHAELDAPVAGSGFQKLAAARSVVRVRWAEQP